MCNCRDVDFGTYENSTVVELPEWFKSSYKTANIDNCILDEIKFLWSKKIKTEASCCGHNKIYPTVIVDDNSIKKMLKLGYKQVGARENMFFLKSVKFEPYKIEEIE